MLKEQPAETSVEDPLLGIFEEGVDEFVLYQKQHSETYKSHNQKKKEKIAKLQRDLNDVELKRKRNAERRIAEKAKINQILNNMSQEEIEVFIEERRKKKKDQKQKVKRAMATGQVIMVDLAYEQAMNGKENKSLAKQLQLIIKGIKQVESPPSIHLCNFQGIIVNHLQKMGSAFWPVTTHVEDISEAGKKIGKKLIYLSPDAELPLEKIEPDTGYIIGGLIDRTIIKYASLNRAKSFGIECRRLPIRQFMKSRIVLNLDHVVLILCKFSECGDWKVAFDYGAPKRYKRDAGEKKEQKQGEDEAHSSSGEASQKEEEAEQTQQKCKKEQALNENYQNK